MRKIITLTFLASALGVAGLLGASQKVVEKEAQDARIIVSFKSYSENMTQAQVAAYQDYSLSLIREEVTSNFTVKQRYKTLLNGVVLTVPSSQVYAIRNLSFVDNVDYDTVHHEVLGDGEIMTVTRAGADAESENISGVTMNVPENTNKGEGVLVGILDTGFLINHTHEGKVYTHESFTALDSGVATKLSKSDVDSLTGLNAEAKDVDSLYFNSKVPFYYNYGGKVDTRDDYGKVFNTSNDVYSPVSDHGQHVASMAAGNGPSYKGIASNAQLALFKTSTDYIPNSSESKTYAESSGFFDSAVIAALEDAKILGCDVLNMSFGSDLNDFEDDSIVHKLLADLLENGIWSNYAAGNSGKGYYGGTAYQGWTMDMIETGILSGSANLESVMTVGASQAQKEFYNTAIQINGQNISYMDEVNADDNTHLFYDISENGTKTFDWVRVPNYGEAKDYEGVDVNGKVAIVSRGSNTFEDKVLNAQKGKAVALAVINTSNDSVKMSFGNTKPKIPVILLSYDDKDKLGDATSGTLKVLQDVFADNPTATRMATFTSDGATYDLRIKPDISAPGQNVRGAVYEDKKGKLDPTMTDTYAYWSGTSMATPNYSGAVALLIGEHLSDANYYKTVNARTMSTATQYVDKKGVVSSVRVQGAGVVNVGNALESKIYLEGSAGSGKAKIQLQNNDDIKAGNLNLTFSATNEGTASVTFKAYIDIYRPDVFKYEKMDSEIIDVKDITIQGYNNVLLRTVEKDVTIPVGTSTIALDTIALTAEEKKFIDDNFEYACPIEGYVRLESASATNLSIPFLGYYGDVSAASPVEPFNFEKQEGVVYPSTLIKDVASLVEFPNADYASSIIAGYFKTETWGDHEDDDNYTSPLTSWYTNKSTFVNINGDNGYPCFEIGSKKNADGSYSLYSPNGKTANTILIQQCVTRSVKTNELNIIRKSDNKVILQDHMFDSFWGDSGDEETGEEPNYSLAKSHVLSDYLSAGYIAHRAYSIIPLWDNEEKSETYLEEYAEGEYTLEFKYVTMDNVVHTKSYDFVITNAAPEITSVSENGNYIRVRYDSAAGAGEVNVTGQINTKVSAQVDENGYYADLPKAALTKAGKFFFSSGSLSRISCNSIMKVVDGEIYAVTSSEFTVNHDYKVAKSGSGNNISYTFTFTKNNSNTTLTKPVLVTIPVPAGYDASQLTVTDTLKDGTEATRNFVSDNFGLSFESDKGTFSVAVSGAKTHSVTGIGANLSKDTYIVGDTFDASTLSVYSIYDNGVTEALTSGYTYSGFDSSSVGKKQLTVTANGMTATVEYEVLAAPSVTKIEARSSKLSYEVGETFDISVLTVVATYSDGTTKAIDNSKVTVSGFDSSVAGKVTITIAYEGVSTTLELTIVEPAPQPQPNKGCGGEIAATSILLSLIATTGIALVLISKKRKED